MNIMNEFVCTHSIFTYTDQTKTELRIFGLRNLKHLFLTEISGDFYIYDHYSSFCLRRYRQQGFIQGIQWFCLYDLHYRVAVNRKMRLYRSYFIALYKHLNHCEITQLEIHKSKQ